jgi:hypothetical protein
MAELAGPENPFNRRWPQPGLTPVTPAALTPYAPARFVWL